MQKHKQARDSTGVSRLLVFVPLLAIEVGQETL